MNDSFDSIEADYIAITKKVKEFKPIDMTPTKLAMAKKLTRKTVPASPRKPPMSVIGHRVVAESVSMISQKRDIEEHPILPKLNQYKSIFPNYPAHHIRNYYAPVQRLYPMK